MRKSFIFLSIIFLISCTHDDICRGETVGESVWIWDGGDPCVNSMQYKADGFVSLGVSGGTLHFNYHFDEQNCNLVHIPELTPSDWTITKTGTNNITFQTDTITAYFHRQ